MASLWPQAIAEARAIHPFERLVLDAARIAAIRHRSGEPSLRSACRSSSKLLTTVTRT